MTNTNHPVPGAAERDVPPIDLASAIVMTADALSITDLDEVNADLFDVWRAQADAEHREALIHDYAMKHGPIFRAWIEMIFFSVGSQREFDNLQEEIHINTCEQCREEVTPD